ncbi:836_t:CDS:1, partial [Funneliformis geosporum]
SRKAKNVEVEKKFLKNQRIEDLIGMPLKVNTRDSFGVLINEGIKEKDHNQL